MSRPEICRSFGFVGLRRSPAECRITNPGIRAPKLHPVEEGEGFDAERKRGMFVESDVLGQRSSQLATPAHSVVGSFAPLLDSLRAAIDYQC